MWCLNIVLYIYLFSRSCVASCIKNYLVQLLVYTYCPPTILGTAKDRKFGGGQILIYSCSTQTFSSIIDCFHSL